MRDRIHVESLGQPPALARHQHVEHDARPQLTQVGVRLRAVDHQDTGDLQVTGTGGGLVIIAFQGEAGRLQCPQLAERGRSEAVPVGVDGDRDGPGSATRFWRSALDQCGQGFRTGEAAVRDPGRAGGFQRIARFWRWVWQLLRRCRAWGGGRLRGSTTGCLQPGVLQFAAHGIGPPQQFDIALKPQNLHDRSVGAERHSRAAALDAAQSHRRHACTLGQLLGRQFPAKARHAQPSPELDQQCVGRRKQGCSFPGHSAIILVKTWQ